MLSVWIATTTNQALLGYSLLKSRAVRFGWGRQITIQLTVLLVGLLYACSVLELDLNETGDSFGDVYDTYVPSTPVQTPKSSVGVYRGNQPAQLVLTPNQRPIAYSVDWSFVIVLIPLALHAYRPYQRRRLQVLHAIWRL